MPRAESTGTLGIDPAPVSSVSIPPFSLPRGTAGVTYSFTLPTPVGGPGPFVWSVTPALPAGLTLDPNTGIISGTPTAAVADADYSFSIA